MKKIYLKPTIETTEVQLHTAVMSGGDTDPFVDPTDPFHGGGGGMPGKLF